MTLAEIFVQSFPVLCLAAAIVFIPLLGEP